METVEITVKSVKGHCSAGYRVGDSLVYSEPNITSPAQVPVCLYAFSGLFPYLSAFGKKTAQEDWINSLEELQCPDPVNTVVFSLKRKQA